MLGIAIASTCLAGMFGAHSPSAAIATPALISAQTDPSVLETSTQALFERLFEGFGAVNILIIFLLTLGPLKLIGSFAKLTANAEPALRRQLAFRSFGISTSVIFGVALFSKNILKTWQIDLSAMLIATGIILFLVALQSVLAQYTPPTANASSPTNPSLDLTVHPLVFPAILTPYGIGVVVTLSAMFGRAAIAIGPVLGLLLGVMALNFGAMLAARPILSAIKPVTLKVLGFVFGVMQVALGLDMILSGIKIEAIALTLLVGS